MSKELFLNMSDSQFDIRAAFDDLWSREVTVMRLNFFTRS